MFFKIITDYSFNFQIPNPNTNIDNRNTLLHFLVELPRLHSNW